MKRVTGILIVILITSAIGVAWLASTGKVADIYTITYKTVIQLLVISIFGHLVSLLMSKLNNEREELKAKDKFKHDILDKLNNAYFDVKRIRRLARAKNTPENGGYPEAIYVDNYNESMESLNDIQLRLESIAKEIESSQAIFKEYRDLQKNIDSLEEFLNEIVDEFEHTFHAPSDTPPKINLDSIPKFKDLVLAYKGSTFRTSFVKPYYIAIDIIRSTLLYVGSNHSRKRPGNK